MTPLGARAVVAALLVVALAAGGMARYSAGVRHDRATARVFLGIGIAATVGAVASGWLWL
ncbi:MAG: hypothetical protein ACYDCK_09285 [Thermoplasmatota archaeon]